MNSPKKLLTLIEKDFFEFFASKSWIVVILMPLFITFLYSVIYRQAESKLFTIACPSNVSTTVQRVFTVPNLKLKFYQNLNNAKKDLTKGKINGVILNNSSESGAIRLLVDKTKAQEVGFVINALNTAIIRAYSPKNIPLIKLVYLNSSIAIRWISLPIWLIQIILTICLLLAAASISDEKERQTIHSLLVSPMTFADYLLAKIIWNSLIGITAILLTLLLIGATVNIGAIILLSLLGCMIYSTISTLIGLFAPNAFIARSVATLIYIISALPIMVNDLSFNWKGLLNIFPSYLILYGLERSLLPHPYNTLFFLYALGLFIGTAILFGITYFTVKQKADF